MPLNPHKLVRIVNTTQNIGPFFTPVSKCWVLVNELDETDKRQRFSKKEHVKIINKNWTNASNFDPMREAYPHTWGKKLHKLVHLNQNNITHHVTLREGVQRKNVIPNWLRFSASQYKFLSMQWTNSPTNMHCIHWKSELLTWPVFMEDWNAMHICWTIRPLLYRQETRGRGVPHLYLLNAISSK